MLEISFGKLCSTGLLELLRVLACLALISPLDFLILLVKAGSCLGSRFGSFRWTY